MQQGVTASYQWLKADLESKQLLGNYLKRIKGLKKDLRLVDASFIWTECHSKQVSVKITVEKEIESQTILKQSLLVGFTIQNHMCDYCHRLEAQDFWKAVVQVRQRTDHRKTLLSRTVDSEIQSTLTLHKCES